MKRKYVLDCFQLSFILFCIVIFGFLITAIYITVIRAQDVYQFVIFNKEIGDDFVGTLIFLVMAWYFIYIGWREFRFPVIWLSDSGIIALAIIIIPVKVHIPWENVLSITETKILGDAFWGYGTSISIKPTGKVQQRVFKVTGGNEVFISNRISQYDELVNLITEKIK